MSPIRVRCETCNTRLRVRDPGFVGEVHACPRCGGMVLITAPAIAEGVAAETPPPEPSEPTATLEAVPSVEMPALDAEPDIDVAAQAAAGSRLTKALAPAITAAALTASAGLLWIAYGGEAPAPNAAANSEGPVAVEPIVDPPIAAEPRPIAEEVSPEPGLPRVVETEPAPAEPPTPTSDEPLEWTPREEEPAPVARNPVADEAAEPAIDTNLPAEIDPLDFDPATIDLVLRRGGEPVEAPTVEPAAPPVPIAAEPAVTDVIDERLALAARIGGISVRRGPTSDTTNRPPTTPADELLAAKLPAIDLAEVPLVDAVNLLAELVGAPITLSPQTLLHAGVGAGRKIDVAGENVALSRLVADSLRPVRLELRAEGPQAWLSRVGSQETREITHRIGDLAGTNADDFFTLLGTVGPADLVLPDPSGGEGLTLEAPGATHYELLLLCERLRVARGKPPQTKYPRRLLPTEPSLAALSRTLERRTTFSFVEPTPLRDVVAHWRRATGLVVLVDWRSLGDVGLGPRSTIECAVTNRPWAEALDGVLSPLGLGWAAVGQTLWVTSVETLAATPLVEFYPVSRTAGDDFVTRLDDRLAGAGVVYDTPGGVAIVRGDAAAQLEAYDAWRELTAGP